MYKAMDKTVVVLDVGQAYTKCGFSSEGQPRHVVRSPSDPEDDTALEVFLRHVFLQLLQVNPKDRRMLIVESMGCTDKRRQQLARVLFEKLQVPRILFAPAPLLATYVSGGLTALVLDIGYLDTAVVPVIDGVVVTHAVSLARLGSKTIFEALSSAAANNDGVTLDEGTTLEEEDLEDIVLRACIIRPTRDPIDGIAPVTIKTPKAGNARVSAEMRTKATEVLFGLDPSDQSEISLQSMILDSVLKSAIDVRKPLTANVITSGGTVLVPGLAKRLVHEVHRLAEEDIKYKTVKAAVQDLHLSAPLSPTPVMAWIGGSIVAELSVSTEQSLTREAYLEKPVSSLPDWVRPTSSIPKAKVSPQRRDVRRLSARRLSASPRTASPSVSGPTSNLAPARE